MGVGLVTSIAAQGEPVISAKDVRIIDGNNLVINGRLISLYGIKAPELGTSCGSNTKTYDCGLIARSSLIDMSAGARIVCTQAPARHNKNKYKCLSNGYDLSEGMVYTGWASPLNSAPQLFKRLAQEAKDKRRGMWRLSHK